LPLQGSRHFFILTLHRRIAGHPQGTITALAFSPDGNRLATGSRDTTMLIWDLAGS
jgi:WD40 repeat protein